MIKKMINLVLVMGIAGAILIFAASSIGGTDELVLQQNVNSQAAVYAQATADGILDGHHRYTIDAVEKDDRGLVVAYMVTVKSNVSGGSTKSYYYPVEQQ